MKQLISTLVFIFFIEFVYSQKIDYSIFQEPYNELSSGINEQPNTKYDSNYHAYFTLPFTFLFNEIVSEEVDVYGPGYVNLIDITDTNIIELVTLYPFFTYKLVDKSIILGQNNIQSSLTHKTDVLNGEKIYKIQWKNIGFLGCSINDSLNMQVWIFEHSNKVQYRYGKSNMTSMAVLNNPDTPLVAVEVETLNDFYYGTFDGTPNNYNWGYMNANGRSIGVPIDGMVIELKSTESPVYVNSKHNDLKLLIKRNSEFIEVVSKDSNSLICGIEIYDINYQKVINTNSHRINIENLNSGMYLLKVIKNNGLVFERFIK